MITWVQNYIYAYEKSYSHIILFLAPCGILRTLIEAIYKRNSFIIIAKQLVWLCVYIQNPLI